MNTVLLILAVAFGLAFLFIIVTAAYSSAWISGGSRRTSAPQETAPADRNGDQRETDAAGSERALHLVAQLPADTEAWKCRQCGATIDSTAELSANGEVRCNYCDAWTSIYQ